jgi:hypothetical protein
VQARRHQSVPKSTDLLVVGRFERLEAEHVRGCWVVILSEPNRFDHNIGRDI